VKLTRIRPAFTDHRGSIADIFYKAEIHHVGIIDSVEGALRGNHFHKQTTQHTYVTRGSMRYYWQPADKSVPVQSVLLGEGEMATSEPGEVHAMVMLEPCQFLVFSSGVRGGADYEADTFRETIVAP
jgi:dTDP-4-dehydrorhamnose 3,5-epimerase-like enzyme